MFLLTTYSLKCTYFRAFFWKQYILKEGGILVQSIENAKQPWISKKIFNYVNEALFSKLLLWLPTFFLKIKKRLFLYVQFSDKKLGRSYPGKTIEKKTKDNQCALNEIDFQGVLSKKKSLTFWRVGISEKNKDSRVHLWIALILSASK